MRSSRSPRYSSLGLASSWRNRVFALTVSVICVWTATPSFAQDSTKPDTTSTAGNPACLDESNPWYPHKDFPKLITPQWVGEDGVDAVIVLAIDDMRDPAKYEAWLRPVLNRLKQIDGRAPVSIMTNEVKPDDAQLQSWLGEGLSIECHTIDHPCPILQGGDFAKAKSTYDRCVDLMGQIPNNKPVAFRTPCCDSLNTVSPRFFSEIFSGTTENGNVLQIDSSVFMFYTSEDESLPKDRVLDSNGKERFWKYLPKNNKYGGNTHDTFVNYIKNYPYPYVINNSCWEIPCLAPSDWSAQHLHGVHNPMTVDDWKAAIDLTVHKQGCFSLVFHPHGWIKPEQVVEMIDHAVAKHGNKVKFLNFREVAERLEKAESGKRKADFVASKRRHEQTHNCEQLAAARALVQSKEFNQWWSGESQSPPFGLKPIRRPDGTPNGFFIHERHFCWINEDTAKLPDLMYRVSFDEVLAAAHSSRRSPSDEPAKHDDASDVNGKATNKDVAVHHSESDGHFEPVPIGAAVVDITPDYGVRLTGYGNRLKESEGVAVKIHARAMVIGTLASGRASALRDQTPPRTVDISDSTEEQALNRNETHGSDTRRADALPLAILITVDNCGVPLEMTEAVYARIAAKHNIPRANFAICSTHSHSAPWLRGFAPNIFAEVPDDHAAHLAQYEKELTDKLVEVVEQAIASQRPGHLSLGYGETGFAMNRRSLKEGKWVGFGEVPDGPTDKRVPVLAAHDVDGKLIAVLANYACHCTTETGEFNQISGDWAGFAADMLEADFPGAVALIAIGCGADANPSPRGTHEQAKEHGRTMADEVKRVMASGRALALRDHAQQSALPSAQGRGQNEASANNAKIAAAVSSPEEEQNALGGLTPSRSPNASLHRINPAIRGNIARIDLPLAPIPTRAEWEEAAKRPGVEGSRARYFLKMLEDGQEIPTTVPNYPVQTWCFGDDLAMVFLGGEVVVDYSIRMNDMFVSDRLWINAYSNDVPCYIASARLLREGGYECDSSMLYYRRPTRLAPEAEDLICDTVQKLLPHSFYSEALQKDFPAPKAPEESLKCMTTRPDLRIVLAASEPLIRDPVAFDWDERGRLWVVEMGDYPGGHSMASGRASALREPGSGSVDSGQSVDALGGLTPSRSPEPSGRVRLLEDTDHNGVYDKATTFLDNLAFPNGIHCWRGGVIVTMAPEVFYAEDTSGDNVADVRKTLYRGFVEGNQQHRINGLRWGLDGWLYLANGDSGGVVEGTGLTPETQASGRASALREHASDAPDTEPAQNALGGLTPNRSPVSLRGRDLRINPDTNELDAVSGQTQFGRERDDFGNWFGNNNSNPIYQFVLEDHYVRRNPHAIISQVIAQVAAIPGAAPVYPTSRTLARFNDFAYANRFTSACSTMIYRDTYLGEQFYGNAFTCEPVHNLVSRLVLTRDGYGFKGERAPDEQQSEFLASSDNWFRPTMVRTGPDGAIWVADMYRAVIEHPEWIPAEYQRKMNLYAGNDMGRIYRIVPAGECCGSASGRASALRDNALSQRIKSNKTHTEG
ncbi:MAG: neutral/alkaline non-lysosomal ceramidase N-terminal domain-containing protein [Planctomycetaceae bacterium]